MCTPGIHFPKLKILQSIWLVGGFAASPWLFSQLQTRLSSAGVTVSRPDSQTSKAVADGAIGFYCDHHVSARMSKYMYGVEFLREYDAGDEEHIARQHRLFELPSGPKLLPDAFDCILTRVSLIFCSLMHSYDCSSAGCQSQRIDDVQQEILH